MRSLKAQRMRQGWRCSCRLGVLVAPGRSLSRWRYGLRAADLRPTRQPVRRVLRRRVSDDENADRFRKRTPGDRFRWVARFRDPTLRLAAGSLREAWHRSGQVGLATSVPTLVRGARSLSRPTPPPAHHRGRLLEYSDVGSQFGTLALTLRMATRRSPTLKARRAGGLPELDSCTPASLPRSAIGPSPGHQGDDRSAAPKLAPSGNGSPDDLRPVEHHVKAPDSDTLPVLDR